MKETKSRLDKPMSDFDSLAPSTISSDKLTINYLILDELQKINYLMSVGLASVNEQRPKSHIARGVFFGLRSIESMMSHVLTADYYEQVKPLKEKLEKPVEAIIYSRTREESQDEARTDQLKKNPRYWRYLYDLAPDVALRACSQWYDLLVRQLPRVQLTASPKKPFDIE